MTGLYAALRRRAMEAPERTAVYFGGSSLSYAGLVRRVECAAAHLDGHGIQRGDVVALLMRNSPAFLEIALAANAIGAIFLPINYRLAPPEVAYILEHASARAVYVDDDLKPVISDQVATVSINSSAQANSSLLWPSVRPRPLSAASIDPNAAFRLMYTSGTTDRPKGVTHTYSNFYWKCLDHAAVLDLSSAERLLVCGPLFHVGAFDLPGMAVLLFGGAICLHREFDPAQVLESIDRHALTGAWMAPAMLGRVLQEPAADVNLSSFRWCIGGGERTPEERIRAFNRTFLHARFIDSYGLTETCSGDTFMPEGRELDKIGSVGLPVPHATITLRDDAGVEVPIGTEGEICIAGPKVTPGYWRDPERTRQAFFGNALRTGDIGRFDADGYLWVTDRKKDMIISGGENIASAEIERVIDMLPQVREVAVVGMHDDRWGERPVAVVVLHERRTLSEQELIDHCASQLAKFKVPNRLILVRELPRSASGKVLKRLLRQTVLEQEVRL
jgi:acyl-CoA synthetase (AMP-forming)/AMP-acid ligase II